MQKFDMCMLIRFSYYIAIFLRYRFLKPIFQQMHFFVQTLESASYFFAANFVA